MSWGTPIMPYTAGYLGRGFRFRGNFDDPATKKRKLDFLEDVALAADQPEVAGFIQGVGNTFSGNQVVPESILGSRAVPSSGMARASRARGGRWRGRRWWKRRRRSFNSKVGSAMLKFTETKRFLDSVAESDFTAGDGTTRRLHIASPIAQITQGTEGQDISGDQFWIKACWLRGRISLGQATNAIRVRILLIGTRQFADLGVGFTEYNSTTTALTNPTQVAPEANIRIFETSAAEEAGQPSAPFVGNASGIDIIDTDHVYVLGGKEYFLGTENLNYFQNVDVYVPINRKWRAQSNFDVVQADQLRSFRDLNYYWILQVFSNSNANNILVAQDILATFDIITYFKEV